MEILDKVEREPHHWPVGRAIFQKLAYFATREGIPTGLDYHRSSFGPYSNDLKGLLTRLVNNGLIREERLGQMFVVKVGPTFKDARKAYETDLDHWRSPTDKLADLFLRMSTSKAEVAATVYFAATSLARPGHAKPPEKDVLGEVMRWKQRRRPPLNERDVAQTIRHLGVLGWLDVTPSSDLPVSEEAILGV